jgi:hypothetical protein
MKTILKKMGLDGLLRIENHSWGWIEPYEKVNFLKNLISEEEIMQDLNDGTK